jgi:hypothetical protein
VFKSYDGKAVFNGGKKIDIRSAKLVEDAAVLDRLSSAGRGKIYSVVVEDKKVKYLLAKESTKLSYDGQMMNLAKYPNTGYGHIDKIFDKGAIYAQGRTKGDPPKYSMNEPIGGVFSVLNKEISAWEKEFARVQKATITGYLSNDWYKENHRVASIEDARIRLLEYSRYGIGKKQEIPRRFIIKNLLCELDSEGEFYYDEQMGILFFWPFGVTTENATLSIWAGMSFADMKGAKNIRFENIVVEGVSQGPAVVNIKDCKNVELAGCIIRNCSRPAVIISGGKHCGIRSCDIYDVPHHLTLEGGNVPKLIPSGHYAINNHFTQVQAADFYGRIKMEGVGQIFKHNLVHNFIGQVMVVSGNDQLLEYNELFNIGIEEGDGGTIYTCGQMWSYGNVIRHNFLHHIMCIPQAHPRGGIYPDHLDAGETITENIFYKCAHRAVLLNGGAGHVVSKNIFLDGYIGVYQTAAWSQKWYDNNPKYDSGELKRGDITDHIWRTEQVVSKEGWNRPPWSTKYPLFKKVMNQEKMRWWPIECTIADNLFCGNAVNIQFRASWGKDGLADIGEVEYITASKNRDVTKDIFVNAGRMDFRIKSSVNDAPQIEFEKIGLYKDEFRTEVPDKNRYRGVIHATFANRKSYDLDAKYDPVSINDLVYFNTGKLLMQDN